MENQHQIQVPSKTQDFDLPDFITAVVSLIIWGAMAIIPSKPLSFPSKSQALMNPYTPTSTIPTVTLGIIVGAIGVPLIVGAYFLQKRKPEMFRSFQIFTAFWCFLSCIGITNVCVGLFKNMVGRPRPDFLGRCGIDATNDPKSCNISEKEFYEQFRSWPSAHSSTAMSAFLFLAMFLQKVLLTRRMWATFLSSLLVIFAFYVGSTRIRDFKHNPDDVIAGFFCGLLFTYLVWQRTFKRIFPKVSKKTDDEFKP